MGNNTRLNRRQFLRCAALFSGSPLVAALTACGGQQPPAAASVPVLSPSIVARASFPPFVLEDTTVAGVQAAMEGGQISARELVQAYLDRIGSLDQAGPTLRSVLEVNPEALQIADALDAERRSKGPRGPLHGIPILLKDNIDTADQLLTTAGSFALIGSRPGRDATVAARLRAAGAIILGKANLSEWANFRSTRSSSGWSARGGQGLNPYDRSTSPCGSSSGSASAVAANLAVFALGTETDGSVVCPAHANGVVGLKPTVGLTSRAGVIPISHSQDSVGTLSRTVRDAAVALTFIAGADARDAATGASAGKIHPDYTAFLDRDGLRGARIGVPRSTFFGYSPEADAIVEAAIETMRGLGAEIIDPAPVPTALQIMTSPSEFTVLLYEFKADLEAYLATRVRDERHPDAPLLRTLADIIAFNDQHADKELRLFGQEIFLEAQATDGLTNRRYLSALKTSRSIAREQGLDAVFDQHKLDALVAPTGAPAWTIDHATGDHPGGGSSSPAARAGYPLITVPAGFAGELPVGITFMGRAWSEPTLLRLAYAFEQATLVRRPPAL